MHTIRRRRLTHSVLLIALIGVLPCRALVQAALAQVNSSVPTTERSGPVTLLHRYSFSDASGSTTVTDAVGGQHGVFHGTGQFANGQLVLPGGAADSDGGYVELPSGLISKLPDRVTFEAWVTWQGGEPFQRIFDFGTNSNGPGQHGYGTNYLVLTPKKGRRPYHVYAAYSRNSFREEAPVLHGAQPLPEGRESHVVLTYDSSRGEARLYVDGKLADTQPVTEPLSKLADDNNWLGRSNWPDPRFSGAFNEFRIYSGAMTDADVAASFQRGPSASRNAQ